jgi:parallel beta-helix repeat protein
MKSRVRIMGMLAATFTVAAGLGAAQTAGAVVLACGQTITQSTTLTADVGPCPAGGIIVGADNITLDLAGHRVFGTAPALDGVGIYLENRRNVTVRNGTVTDFDGGVVIRYGSANTVIGITARDNLGSTNGHATGAAFGDGIAIEASTQNRIINNSTINNGPFSGIGLYQQSDGDHPGFINGPATGNLIQGNVVTGNIACRANNGTCDNDGVRIEPNVGPGNMIVANTVNGNGLDGISLFGGVSGQSVIRNDANGNGVTNGLGDGIRVFGFANIVQENTANNNASGGISVARRTGTSFTALPGAINGRNNQLVRNRASGNRFDLWDSNPNCDNNRWRANIGTVVSPPCTLTP